MIKVYRITFKNIEIKNKISEIKTLKLFFDDYDHKEMQAH